MRSIRKSGLKEFKRASNFDSTFYEFFKKCEREVFPFA